MANEHHEQYDGATGGRGTYHGDDEVELPAAQLPDTGGEETANVSGKRRVTTLSRKSRLPLDEQSGESLRWRR